MLSVVTSFAKVNETEPVFDVIVKLPETAAPEKSDVLIVPVMAVRVQYNVVASGTSVVVVVNTTDEPSFKLAVFAATE